MLQVPGSKSISNRVLLMAALGKGACAIRGLLQSDDTQARSILYTILYTILFHTILYLTQGLLQLEDTVRAAVHI